MPFKLNLGLIKYDGGSGRFSVGGRRARFTSKTRAQRQASKKKAAAAKKKAETARKRANAATQRIVQQEIKREQAAGRKTTPKKKTTTKDRSAERARWEQHFAGGAAGANRGVPHGAASRGEYTAYRTTLVAEGMPTGQVQVTSSTSSPVGAEFLDSVRRHAAAQFGVPVDQVRVARVEPVDGPTPDDLHRTVNTYQRYGQPTTDTPPGQVVRGHAPDEQHVSALDAAGLSQEQYNRLPLGERQQVQRAVGNCGARTRDGSPCLNSANCPIPSHRRR